MKPQDYIDARYGKKRGWTNHISLPMASKQHDRNVAGIRAAWKDWLNKDRPIRILALSGSGRHPTEGCAHRESNSKMLMSAGLKAVEGDKDVEVELVKLREWMIEPCNGCYSTASTWCHFPCTCFPHDGMNVAAGGGEGLYEKSIRADVILMSTGVNQSMCSSRIKLYMDRMISADGGIFIPEGEFDWKGEEWLQKMLSLAASGEFSYSPRLALRPCGFFITSKDETNELGGQDGDVSGDLKYKKLVAYAMKSSMEDYGCLFADPWFAWSTANPHEEMMFDAAAHSKDTAAHEQAKKVVTAAVELARKARKSPDDYLPKVDRINRT